MLATNHPVIWCHIQEEWRFQLHCSKSLKSHNVFCKFPTEWNTFFLPYDCCSDKYLYATIESDGFCLLECDILQPGRHKSVFQSNFTDSIIKVGHLTWGWNQQNHLKFGTLLQDYVTSHSRRQQSSQSPMSELKISPTSYYFYLQILEVQKELARVISFILHGSTIYLHA